MSKLEVVLILYTDMVGGLVGHVFVALKFIFWIGPVLILGDKCWSWI